MTTAFAALALQTVCHSINALAPAAAREKIASNIARIDAQVTSAKRFLGTDLKLVVLPEYAVTGFPWGESATEWQAKAAFAPGGAEYDGLAQIGSANNLFLAGNHYETDPHFPALYFQASTIIAPSGDIVLRYRRLVSLFAPSPFDVLDAYLDTYGAEAMFPVADTEIGRLGAIASEEILHPELARILASKGAEILIHSSSEVSGPLPAPKAITRHARAVENLAYVVSANSAGIFGIDIPAQSTDGGSEIIDCEGTILARSSPGDAAPTRDYYPQRQARAIARLKTAGLI
jgi:deaminated glutathione amidase